MASLLLLYNFSEERVTTVIRQNVEAFQRFSSHQIFPVDAVRDGLDRVDLSRFDGVIIHWTVVIAEEFRPHYLGNRNFERLVDYSGPKFVFVQDEYRWVGKTIEALCDLRATVLFSALCPKDRAYVYDDPRMRDIEIAGVLHGYLDPALPRRSVIPFRDRKTDVGYRARDLSGEHAWLGELAQEKGRIAHRFLRDTSGAGLRLDVSTRWEDRLFGDDWLKFVAECKAVLGSETGASICDRDDSIRQKVLAYVAAHPAADFEEIRSACFPGQDWKMPVRGISPRILEAAALRTLMINYEGNYQGFLEPWVHYVPLKKDHSNLPEVISILRDDVSRAESIIARAYDDVGCNPAFHNSGFVELVDGKIAEHIGTTRGSLVEFSFEQVRAGWKHESLLRKLDKQSAELHQKSEELHRKTEELHRKTEELQSLHLNLGRLQHQHGEAIYWVVGEIELVARTVKRTAEILEESRRSASDLGKMMKQERSASKQMERAMRKLRTQQQRITLCLALLLLFTALVTGGCFWLYFRGRMQG